MSEEKGYQGWANYPTWVTYLWLSNDEGLYDEAKRICQPHARFSEVQDELKDFVWNLISQEDTEIKAGLASDLLQFGYDSIEWFEIVDSFSKGGLENVL